MSLAKTTLHLVGKRAITGDTALRLAHFFGTSAQFWLNLQSLYDLRLAQEKVGKSIKALPSLNGASWSTHEGLREGFREQRTSA